MLRFLFLLALCALALSAWLSWTLLRPALLSRRVRRARQQFERQRIELENEFFHAAAATGKPRGLAWKSCAFEKDITLTRDRANGELVGLVGVTIGFEAVEGGGMEHVEAVHNLRAATAIFTHNGRHWTTSGRAVFNLEPHEVVAHYRGNLERVST